MGHCPFFLFFILFLFFFLARSPKPKVCLSILGNILPDMFTAKSVPFTSTETAP